MTSQDLLDSSFRSFVFDKNDQLRAVGVIQSMNPEKMYLENYLMKIRKIYSEVTVSEVNWWPPSASSFILFNSIHFGRIIGYPKTERAKTAHTIPGLITLGTLVTGGSLCRDLRRSVYLFENSGGLLIASTIPTAGTFIYLYKLLVLSYFYERKYEVAPFEKECVICWAAKSVAIFGISLIAGSGVTQLYIQLYDDIFGSRKIRNMDDLFSRKFVNFWSKIYKDSIIKNGRPRIGLTSGAMLGTISLAVYQSARLIEDEEIFRRRASTEFNNYYQVPKNSVFSY